MKTCTGVGRTAQQHGHGEDAAASGQVSLRLSGDSGGSSHAEGQPGTPGGGGDGGGGGAARPPRAPDGKGPRCAALACWRRRCQATLAVLRRRPAMLLTVAAVFAVLCGTGLAGVLLGAAAEAAKARDLAANGIGAQVAQSLKEALLVSSFGSELLASAVVHTPHCADIEAAWGRLTEYIMSRIDPAVVRQLELDFAGVIWKTHPPLTGDLADFLYGRDLLREPSDRPGMLYTLRERRELILGPYTCTEGFKCAFTVTPVFLPAPSEDYDWGCGQQPFNCSELCWDAASGTKFWGQVSTMLDLSPFFSGDDVRLQLLASRGYHYKLWQAETSFSNPQVLLANSTADLVDPVVREIAIRNLVWVLELAPRHGWVAPWRDPCLAAVVLGAGAVAALVAVLLLSREQHDRLLREMLPGKVIAQLQSGAHAIAEHFDCVTVLFSDIVGYTAVASELTPFQVVTLLNELFSVFDDLVHRNGVYKVETIGDALMCVAGCPAPQPPADTAAAIAGMALDMVAAAERFRPSLEGLRLRIRVGIHSGPVVAGVVGKRMPRYCLFGDTVNTASRMESTSQPMAIQVSSATAELLRSLPGSPFVLEHRGPVEVKGKGLMATYWLRAADPDPSSDPSVGPRADSLTAIVSRPAPGVTVLPPPQPQQQTQTHLTRQQTGPRTGSVKSLASLGSRAPSESPRAAPALTSRSVPGAGAGGAAGPGGAAAPGSWHGLGGMQTPQRSGGSVSLPVSSFFKPPSLPRTQHPTLTTQQQQQQQQPRNGSPLGPLRSLGSFGSLSQRLAQALSSQSRGRGGPGARAAAPREEARAWAAPGAGAEAEAEARSGAVAEPAAGGDGAGGAAGAAGTAGAVVAAGER